MIQKVTFITNYSNFYGANRSLIDLIEGLREHQISSFVICPSEGRLTKVMDLKQIPYKVLPFKGWMTEPFLSAKLKLPFRILTNLLILPFVAKTVKHFGAELIYTNGSCTVIGQATALMLNLPHIWHVREFGTEDLGLRYDFGERFSRKIINKSDTVIAISKVLAEKKLSGLKKTPFIVYNGVVNKEKADKLVKEKQPDGTFTFVIIGSIIPQKGQLQAIKAMSLFKNSNVRLYICGEGKPEHIVYLKSLAENLQVLDKIVFTGFIEDPFEILQKSDCLLMCSQNEAFGRVTAEAMFAGLPVIGYKGGATPELVKDNVNGLLYENGYEQLANCMKRLIDNPQLAHKLGKKGRHRALEYYTIERCAFKIADIINKTIFHSHKNR